jgi:hypothetical protein
MKPEGVVSAVALIVILVGSITLVIVNPFSTHNTSKKKPFYVGVTFCGNTTIEAKQLVDRVKNYTNLFVLQSGPLERNTSAINEIGDYATSFGLNFLIFWGVDAAYESSSWINEAKQRWSDKFIGIYYGDEPGGKMLDSAVYLNGNTSGAQILKGTNGVTVTFNGTKTTYYTDGRIRVDTNENATNTGNDSNGTLTIQNTLNGSTISITNVSKPPSSELGFFPNGTYVSWLSSSAMSPTVVSTTYYQNGTITLMELPDLTVYTRENGTEFVSQLPSYDYVLSTNPLRDYKSAGQVYVNTNKNDLMWLKNMSVPVFTSDYGLYWWDYLTGYDVVLAEFGWNHTATQDMALVRGAANMQNKNWGAMITWTYTQSPYLADGETIYNQMRLAYENGASYVVVFNYATAEGNGTMEEEHFRALERFWNELVVNPKVGNEIIDVNAVLILPNDYGWGLRNSNDTIWGLWPTDTKSSEVWLSLQSNLAKYGSMIDIIFDDGHYNASEKYSLVLFWNQTQNIKP